MHDPKPARVLAAGGELAVQPVEEGALILFAGRVNEQACLLVDHDEVTVFVQDAQFDRLRRHVTLALLERR
jgi:hypothetical protein